MFKNLIVAISLSFGLLFPGMSQGNDKISTILPNGVELTLTKDQCNIQSVLKQVKTDWHKRYLLGVAKLPKDISKLTNLPPVVNFCYVVLIKEAQEAGSPPLIFLVDEFDNQADIPLEMFAQPDNRKFF